MQEPDPIQARILEQLEELNRKQELIVQAINVIAPAVNWLTENTQTVFNLVGQIQANGGIQGMLPALMGMANNG